MSTNISNTCNQNFIDEGKHDRDNVIKERYNESNSTSDNNEKSSLIQVLHSYDDFQKKNMNYGKINPYKRRETQLGKMRKTLVRLFSISDLEIHKENDDSEKNKKKKKVDTTNFLTSRAAMWNEVEKNDDPTYDLKLESSKNKSFIETILNYICLLINDTLNDKKGMTYIASFMIILSVIITFISGLITLFMNTRVEQKSNWKLNTSKNNYDDINKFMNYIKVGDEDVNNNNFKLQALLEQFKNSIHESMKESMRESMKENVKESMKESMKESTNLNYKNKNENTTLYELNENLQNKLKELEKKLIINTKDIDNFKTNSKIELENLKKKLQEIYESFQNKFKDYVNTMDTIKKDMNKKNSYIYDVERKINKNQIDIKKDVSHKVENEKKELLETINELQKKIKGIESKLSTQVFAKGRTADKKIDKEMEATPDKEKSENADKPKAVTTDKAKRKNEEQEGSQNETADSLWISEHINTMQNIQKELAILKESAKKSSTSVDVIFPSIEQKILKNVENKIKYYLEIYKKDIISEITESKVIYNEDKYKRMTQKQEKMQLELLKTINSQIKIQTKSIKEDLDKSLEIIIEKKQLKNDTEYTPKNGVANYDSLEILHKKVDELYNEFILDYNEIDWALESLGARIVYKMTSSPLNRNDFIEKFLNHLASFLPSEEIYGMIKPMGKDPSIILKPSNFPGDCFSFNGSKGKITIHLPATIDVTSISIQHVHENISNNSNATPKYFSVYGIVDLNWPEQFEHNDINYDDFKNSSLYSCLHSVYGKMQSKYILEKWLKDNKTPNLIHIGDFYFDRKKRISSYPTKHCFPIKRIIFEFTENYGAPYTCVYRLKLHLS
ncbi:SUN domain-containing protein [Plasmodium brasilianum]|uniref:SUN domain-containing protein n=1 Tax=Plasmodium brasilianum TaxID=5824 RepID=A0ACB9Y248_PLABR|nr:SUN domain-containing protein [Plasmodium brasilianum]